MSTDLHEILRQTELLSSELAELWQAGPVLEITHRFQAPGSTCLPGEEVWAVALLYRGHQARLPLTLALRLLCNYLAETRHVPQSAAQIVAGIHRNPFYSRHGANSGLLTRKKISRSAIKEYVKRIRTALKIALHEVAVDMDPRRILLSRDTVGKEVQYQLRVNAQWVHIVDVDSRLRRNEG